MSIPQQNHSGDKWLKHMKGSISLTASIIATMTFSLATNPPGGVVQVSVDDKTRCSTIYPTICAGEAILATYYHDEYLRFLICNTICFIASLSVILLLVSGIPINNKFSMWLLSIGMSIVITSLALTYLFAAKMVNPHSIWSSLPGTGFGVALIVWIAIVLLVYIILVVCTCVSCCRKFCS
ncbi:ankyrin repeat protein [Medicago truncatula]|uniref:Ankyrin repeat protein n=1 Tax=Medicago truncatula TaxID=3880 RepID=G7ZXG9_MEDTR|nr:ankyrin repeat protein [Medicago truncatula]KEH18425.1 ankyrin repeat protein [Medicago truncatula]